ncbi:sialate O-acetylesterase [Dyadobacter sandarakinus]|uniref:Sialate O-acetylesterase n=1 Tax=Dyadobacter sandarakinus TaxID=2747268 RepID=A0ABX7IH05_9BACT|nr:sialate O-acetylesterase [Dyadobacter sandarakinus]QRR04146.1 sialate O-acetylesterase [Dyadobacter sandarakinus]
MRCFKIICLLLCFSTALFAREGEKLKLSPVLQSNMVVQQNQPFKVWGHAPAGTTIAIQADWMSSPVRVTADADSRFIGIIPVPVAKKGDFTRHRITISSDDEKRLLDNVLIGETWICSGQSNMQFKMHETLDSAREVPAADYPQVRLFSAGLNFSNEPLDSIGGTWQECTPASVRTFSAVGYHFGRELFARLNVPVGLVFTGIGASAAQAYVPQEVLAADTLLSRVYLQPYLDSPKSQEKIDGGFTFEKVTRPFLLYNAIIHPFVNLSVKGFIWYQGESNRAERGSYTHLTQTMIQSWRAGFGQGNLPFYYVQVAPFWYDMADATLADYAFFREAQEQVSKLANTEMVVTMDVGESRDLHPKNKKPIGVRLAKTALNRTYGFMEVAFQGPKFDYATFENQQVQVHFRPETVRGGLETNDGKAPAHFFVAGADRQFYPAAAKIEGGRIILTSLKVRRPVAVRYAFTNFPVTNLQNKDGLPALPFRSDDWPEITPKK